MIGSRKDRNKLRVCSVITAAQCHTELGLCADLDTHDSWRHEVTFFECQIGHSIVIFSPITIFRWPVNEFQNLRVTCIEKKKQITPPITCYPEAIADINTYGGSDK